MSPQTATNTAPKMKLAVLTVFVYLAAVNGKPSVENGYQDGLSNHLDDQEGLHTETANHLDGLVDTNTASENYDESHHENEEDGLEHTETAEGETNNVANEDEKPAEETADEKDQSSSSSSSESSEESDESMDKEHKHWYSRHKKQKHLSSNGKELAASKKKKVSTKVNKMVRQQVLKKASVYSGAEIKPDDGGALSKKLRAMMTDATIRKMAPKVFAKPMHGVVDLLKNHLDTLDTEKQGNIESRTVDTFYERAFAREIGFRAADRIIDTVSTVLGGALAAGTIHQLHKKSHEDVNPQVVANPNAENVAQPVDQLVPQPVDQLVAQPVAEVVQEAATTDIATQTRGLHSKLEKHKRKREHKKEEHKTKKEQKKAEHKKKKEKKGHFWSKSKYVKEEEQQETHHEKTHKHHHGSSSKHEHQEGVDDKEGRVSDDGGKE